MFIKSRDTEYSGILYRSELEALWATYFDEYRIKHKYEYKTIDLGIDKYLPDFWLPEYKTWIEIKPFKQWRAHSKCYRLALETNKLVWLVQGYPYSDYKVDLFDSRKRRKYSFRTVVSEEEIKPSVENLQFTVDTECGDTELMLAHNSGAKIKLV